MLIETVLVLPISSAICERGFSAVKRIKSDRRSNLRTETMNHLLLASIEGPAWKIKTRSELFTLGGLVDNGNADINLMGRGQIMSLRMNC